MRASLRKSTTASWPAKSPQKDFFVSYTGADDDWAQWIASVLKAGGYSTVMQAWDFGPGCNFVVEMHRALQRCRRLVLVYSPDYFASLYAQAEWAAAFAGDPTGEHRTLLPVRVKACKPAGLLGPIVYCDLVGLPEKKARELLLASARPITQRRPARAVAFPGAKQTVSRTRCDLVRELSDILSTTLVTFTAQSRVRDLLVKAMRRRLRLRIEEEYEAFFHRHYQSMNEEERRQHSTIREYTRTVLYQYNSRALELCEEGRIRLEIEIPSIWLLKNHLTLWLAKCKTAMRRPSTCLVYVGVEEGVGFPDDIDDEVGDFLAQHCGAAGARSGRRTGRESQ